MGGNVLNNEDIEIVTKTDFLRLFVLYLLMMCARFTSISIFMPKLRVYGYGLTWSEILNS